MLGRRSFLKIGFISLALPFGSSIFSQPKLGRNNQDSPDASFIILEWYQESELLGSK